MKFKIFLFAVRMICNKCGSSQTSRFTGELCIHRGGLRSIGNTHLLYPDVIICMTCGSGEFGVQHRDLNRMREPRTVGALAE
jgi:hypothetical protein